MWRFIGAAVLPAVLTSSVLIAGPSDASRVAADVPTYAPGLAAAPGGGFDAVYRASSGGVMLRSFANGAWGEPADLGGRLVGGPAITYAAGAAHVFGRGGDGQLWERIRTGGTWGAWAKVGGLVMSSAPAAAGRSDGRIDVFARDAFDHLQTRTFRPGSGWDAWSALGGVIYSAPAVTMTGTGSMRVVATGKDYAVWTRTLTGTSWSAWSSLGGRTFSGPGIAWEPTGGRVRLAIRDGAANSLRVRTFTTSWGAWRDLGGLHVDGPGMAAGGATTAVVARGRDGAFWALTLTGDTASSERRAWVIGPPAGVPAALRGKNVTKITTTAKVAALTFDGGGNSAGVPSIRATLQRQNVAASVFLVGDFARGFPVYSNLLAGSGYRIANHSDNHPDFTTISDAVARAEVTNARTAIFNTNGAETRPLFRFPFGAYTASDITLLNGLGYVCVGWTVDSLGWQGTSGGQSVTKVVNRVLAAAQPGMIVLMHLGDNPNDHTTLDADALPQIIQGLRTRGYTFVTLDALLL